jgi:hypothetical protein
MRMIGPFPFPHDDDDEPPLRLPVHEAQVMTLREYFADYASGCRFKPGDLVTPKRSSVVQGAGLPHIVVEVLADPIRNFDAPDPSDTGGSRYGARLDMRVICYHEGSGRVAAWWTESWMFEPYTGEEPKGAA